MTRNEYIAQTAMLLYVHKTCEHPVGTAYEEAVLGAKMLANMLEHKGCAPWQDAPPVQGGCFMSD